MPDGYVGGGVADLESRLFGKGVLAAAKREQARRLVREAAELERQAVAERGGCRGWDFHVFTLGTDRRSICGAHRSAGGQG